MTRRIPVTVLGGVLCFLLGTLTAMPLVRATQDIKVKAPDWRHGLDLKVRKAGEHDWKEAKKYGIEVFRDENNGNLIYISETGSISVVPGK